MKLTNPIKDFYVNAVMHAKHDKMQECNALEADLIMVEESLLELKRQHVSNKTIISIETQLDGLKKIIREKKKTLL